MVDSFSSRGGRGATCTFAGRVGSPGIFNAWLPYSTPTGVGAESGFETMTDDAGLVTYVEEAVVTTFIFDANRNQTAANARGSTDAYSYDKRMRTAISRSLVYDQSGVERFLVKVPAFPVNQWVYSVPCEQGHAKISSRSKGLRKCLAVCVEAKSVSVCIFDKFLSKKHFPFILRPIAEIDRSSPFCKVACKLLCSRMWSESVACSELRNGL